MNSRYIRYRRDATRATTTARARHALGRSLADARCFTCSQRVHGGARGDWRALARASRATHATASTETEADATEKRDRAGKTLPQAAERISTYSEYIQSVIHGRTRIDTAAAGRRASTRAPTSTRSKVPRTRWREVPLPPKEGRGRVSRVSNGEEQRPGD